MERSKVTCVGSEATYLMQQSNFQSERSDFWLELSTGSNLTMVQSNRIPKLDKPSLKRPQNSVLNELRKLEHKA